MNNSRLSRLPAELRNRIYELVFEGEKTFKITPDRQSSRPFKKDLYSSRTGHLALTQTCRALRSETVAMFYTSVTLSFAAAPQIGRGYIFPDTIALRFLSGLQPDVLSGLRKVVLEPLPDRVISRWTGPSTDVLGRKYEARQLENGLQIAKMAAGKLREWARLAEVVVKMAFGGAWNIHYQVIGIWIDDSGEVKWERVMEEIERAGLEAKQEGGFVGSAKTDTCTWAAGLMTRVRELEGVRG